jgi:hypothetical protein
MMTMLLAFFSGARAGASWTALLQALIARLFVGIRTGVPDIAAHLGLCLQWENTLVIATATGGARGVYAQGYLT